MEKLRTFIVSITAWFSFLAALWLFLFNALPWIAPAIMMLVVMTVFGLTTTGTKKY